VNGAAYDPAVAVAGSADRARGPFVPSHSDLGWHGDRELDEGLVDLAVNVRAGTPPQWLHDRIRAADVAAYPDAAAAVAAVAARHGRPVEEVLLTAGAAEAFVLMARALRPTHPVVVHPQFTEPELALNTAGHPVHRVVLAPPFVLQAGDVPDAADLVVVGNPTNPTSVLHSPELLRSLARPGRVLVIDEAFADCVPGEASSLAGARDVPGLVVVRSLTKTWGLAGLRVGYVLADAATVLALRAAQPRWPVSAPALAACVACTGASALAEAQAWAVHVAADRAVLIGALDAIPAVRVVPQAMASFILIEVDTDRDVRAALRDSGYAVRRGDTFPGLGPHWLRVAVRDQATSIRFATALKEILCPTSTT
jgi:histidinol-phosphate aminotransferase